MAFKPYHESAVLQILRCLNPRMEFSSEDQQQYFNLEKGHEGEQRFATMLDSLTNDWIILYDLLLESDNSIFQIDALLISQHTIYLFDPKNNEGEYYIESDNWYTRAGKEIKNPVHQLNRSVLLLERLLQKYGFTLPVKGSVVFVHPEFTLFQAPLDLPIILPTQLNRFMKRLSAISSTTNNRHQKLAEKLATDHIPDSPYSRVPDYTFDQLRKGIVCGLCRSLITTLSGRGILCKQCGHMEKVDTSVLRSIKEYQLLFPKKRMTTSEIHKWCGEIVSQKIISRILSTNFIVKGKFRHTYYVDSLN